MSRGNPSLDRAVSILTMLSAAPERSFTLSEIVRQTELSKATCHALLTSLVEARWLLRHPTGPSYRLGPGLIALGEAARGGFPALPYAQDQMRELGAELGLECLASAVVGAEILILAKSGTPAPSVVSAAVGQRVPLIPPLATVFFAWADESAMIAAFARGFDSAHLSTALSEKYRRGLSAVRSRGYSVALENPVRERLGRTFVAQLARGQLTRPEIVDLVRQLADEDYQLLDVAAGERYWLSNVAAPVFDATGRVSLALTLVGFASPLDAAQVHRLGARLRKAADAVTVAVHGTVPRSASLQEVLS